MNNCSNYASYFHIMIHLNGHEGGGIRTLSESWYKGFSQRGIRISYLMNQNGDYTKRLQNEGREVYCVNIGSLQSKSWNLAGFRIPDLIGWVKSLNSTLGAKNQFEKILKEVKPDVVLGNGASSAAVIGPACKVSGIDLVSCFHGISHPDDFLSLRKRVIAFLLNRYCREIVGVSNETLKNIIPYLHIHHRVIFNSVPEVFTNAKTRMQLRGLWGIENRSIVFGNASRISPSKAVHRFVDAADLFIKNNPDVPAFFLIAGEPRSQNDQTYLDNIVRKIKEKNLQDKIRYVGFQPIADFYSTIDVFCHTHEAFEPLGLTVVEAISAGLPIIVCDQGGFIEFLPENIGIRYDGSSHTGLAKAMQKMMDVSFRKEQSSKGRSFFLNDYISYSKWINAWLETLKK